MVQINFAKREVQCKVVYYGPAESGKTTNLRSIHERTPDSVRGALTSIATDGNRTLFFDFLPLDLGRVAGIRTKIHLYAVPYIESHNALRMLVLEGVDGVVFVADSSSSRLKQDIEALENLRENLLHLGRDLADIPVVFQWNKTDVADALAQSDLEHELNVVGAPSFPAVAESGRGVFLALKAITQEVLENVSAMMAPAARRPEPEHEPLVRTTPAAPPPPEPAPEPAYAPAAAEPVEEEPCAPPAFIQDAAADLEAATAPPREPAHPAPYAGAEPAPLPPPVDPHPSWGSPGHGAEPFPAAGDAYEPAPLQPTHTRMVSVGGHRRAQPVVRPGGWDRPQTHDDRHPDRDARPVVDRRRRPRSRTDRQDVPAPNLVAGAVFALIALIAIGYLVYEML